MQMQGGDFTHACNWGTPASRRDRGTEGMNGSTKMVTGTVKLLANATDLGRSYNFSHVNTLWKFQHQLKITQGEASTDILPANQTLVSLYLYLLHFKACLTVSGPLSVSQYTLHLTVQIPAA